MNNQRKAAIGAAADHVPGDAAVVVESGLIELFGDLCHQLGIPRSYGQIYGLAFVSPAPVSFDDVVSRLGLSKGSASQGLRWLREMGLLSRMEPPGGTRNGRARREFFGPLVEISALLQVIIRERVRAPLDSGRNRLAELQRIVENDGIVSGERLSVRTRHLRRQIRRLNAWHRKASAMTPMLLENTS